MSLVSGAGLGSHVARRLFLLFLLAALIPVAGLAYFAYSEVGRLITDLNFRSLKQDAKAVGMGMVQRLSWREQSLKRVAERVAGDIEDGARIDLSTDDSRASGLDIRVRGGMEGLDDEQRAHLRRGGVVLRLTPPAAPEMLVEVAGGTRLIAARLDPDRLWRDEDAADRYCILTIDREPLYCTEGMVPPREGLLPKTMAENTGVFHWLVGGEEHIAGWWRAGLQASLANEGFFVIVSDSKQDVFAVLARFRQTLPAVVILALALAAWLSITQIRRQMRPLERLEAGTSRLARGDFSSRIEVDGNDEFASLASAFNRMAGSLDRKFNLLQALGELDRAILAVSEMDSVVEMLLRYLPSVVACDGAGVLRFDAKGGARLVIGIGGDGESKPVEFADCVSSGIAEGADQLPWRVVDLNEPDGACFAAFAAGGARIALVFPAHVGGRVGSMLALAYRELPADLADVAQVGRSLADRLAAADSSIAWEDKLYRQAHFDALTALPNRVMFRDRLEQAILRADREGLAVAAMLIDLDDFKQVNDTLGHHSGDSLLVTIAERLKGQARATDTVARLAGDEFVVLVSDLHKESAISVVERIAANMSREVALPVELSGRPVSSPASIGIAFYPENADSAEHLLITADAAMYEAKRHGRGAWRFYSASMNTAVKERFELAQELREAIERNEFFLVFQPKIEVRGRRVVGAEALIRWRSPRRGLVPPGLFIPVIDEIGLQGRLGRWVLDRACAEAVAWQEAGLPPLSVSVNVAPSQFQAGGIVDDVREVLARHRLAPELLELEVLESSAVGEAAATNSILARLRDMGVGIALDDFGTGYSSLVYLTQIPANVLKIDRGFIVGLLSDSRHRAIVERIISLAKVLGYVVVAEGVEEEAQAELLAGMECDLIQGYLFSRPLPVDDFMEFVRRSNRD